MEYGFLTFGSDFYMQHIDGLSKEEIKDLIDTGIVGNYWEFNPQTSTFSNSLNIFNEIEDSFREQVRFENLKRFDFLEDKKFNELYSYYFINCFNKYYQRNKETMIKLLNYLSVGTEKVIENTTKEIENKAKDLLITNNKLDYVKNLQKQVNKLLDNISIDKKENEN